MTLIDGRDTTQNDNQMAWPAEKMSEDTVLRLEEDAEHSPDLRKERVKYLRWLLMGYSNFS